MNEFYVKGRYEMIRSWKDGSTDKKKTVELGFARFVHADSSDEAKEKVINAIKKKMAEDDRYTKCESFAITEIAVYWKVA